MRRTLPVTLTVALLFSASCASRAVHFSETNARVHLRMLADTIGSRPVGTAANRRAREYIVDQLELYGFAVRVQEADGTRPDEGTTARVANVIAVKEGDRREAIAIVAHYDSAPRSPGATDDGLGVAVALEAGRLLAARPHASYSLMVLLTDAEEDGLLGAAALTADKAVTGRLAAYVNLDSIGSSGPSILFETGPGNGWIVDAWASAAPRPRGSSYTLEIYRRLPNDTDFSMFKQTGTPGLNFAPTGDSYAYHSARDVSDRVSDWTLQQTGQNTVAIVQRLDGMDLTRRSSGSVSYFDIASVRAISYGEGVRRALALVAILAGAIAGVRTIVALVRTAGLLSLVVTIFWAVLGIGAVGGAMVGATWMLRAVREVYHPWYAHPGRLALLLVMAAITAGWLVSRLGASVPQRVRGLGLPLAVWVVTLPIWTGLAAVMEWQAPAASHLWTIPLLAAGILLSVTPPANALLVRLVSIVVLAVAGTMWIPDTAAVFDFAIPVFGRLATVTPVYAFGALFGMAGAMIAPPLLGTLAATRASRRVLLVATGVILTAFAASLGWAYAAPAYTTHRPQRRYVRYLNDGAAGRAFWEVAGNEPGLDLPPDAPGTWRLVNDAPPTRTRSRALPHPFVFRTEVASVAAAPGSVSARLVRGLWAADVEVVAVPQEPGTTVSFILPPGVVPLQANLAGNQGSTGQWTAEYVAPPVDGVAFRATVRAPDANRLDGLTVAFRTDALPGGTDWKGLPGWLPQDRAVWEGGATYLVPVTVTAQPTASGFRLQAPGPAAFGPVRHTAWSP